MYCTTVECVDKMLILVLNFLNWYSVGWDSSVGIATCYRLDGPGIESCRGGGQIFRTRPDRPTQPPMQWVLGFFPRGKAAGAWYYHPPPSSAEVKERVELYLYSPSGPSWSVIG